MTIYYHPPASIECAHANLSFRKITIKLPPQKHASLGTLYRFKLEIDGKAHIYKELNPQKAIIDPNSHLDKDDGVNGNILLLVTTNLLKKTNYKIKKGSSSHRIQVFLNRCFTFAKIEKQYPSIPPLIN